MKSRAPSKHQPPPTVAEAARALRSSPGLVVLESTLAGDGAISLLGSAPESVFSGSFKDWPELERRLAARAGPGPDLGYPKGAAVGWMGFDGQFCFGFYDTLHVYLHREERWINPPAPVEIPPASAPIRLNFQPRITKEAFCAMVRRALEYISAGDIYQVCLSHRFEADGIADAWPFYEALRDSSPAPFGAFLDLEGRQIASSSPECFLRMSGRRIITRPIKGTRPRRRDAQLDEKSAYDLITSPKEIAELVMITDLERNDLGRVCDFGSVFVSDLLKHERFEQVHHLVSTIDGTLRKDVSHAAALMSCFPGGSISGAPKKRALEIIKELEPFPRGLYTGAIGYFGFNGESQFSIAIRTAVFENNRSTFHVGAGIVADSVPELEWQETLDKAAGLLQAAKSDKNGGTTSVSSYRNSGPDGAGPSSFLSSA